MCNSTRIRRRADQERISKHDQSPEVVLLQGLSESRSGTQAIAKYAFDYIYPRFQGVYHNGSPYWSADCRQGGPLDLTPNDGVWP